MRRYKFSNIPNLDIELDDIVKSITDFAGKKITEFPPINQIPEMSRFIKKVSQNEYEEYIKIDGQLKLLSTEFITSEEGETTTSTIVTYSATTINELLAYKADKINVLELDNEDEFTPDNDYEPATKKYVDDNIGSGGIVSSYFPSGW